MSDKPTVLIAGAGVGGLTIAILLERAGIDYRVFEQAEHFFNYGSGVALGFDIMPLMEQLGLFEDIKAVSKIIETSSIWKESIDLIKTVRLKDNRALTGYDTLITSRMDLHRILLSRIPKEKVLMDHKIDSILQNKEKVSIRCANNTFHEADVLIGADGPYSAVRESLYERLSATGKLTQSDKEDLKISYMTYLGTTAPLDPKDYFGLEDSASHCDTIVGIERPETTRHELPGAKGLARVQTSDRKDDRGPHRCYSTRKSDPGNSGREGLRDMMLPNFGRSALNAMLDAVILANALFEINPPSDNSTPSSPIQTSTYSLSSSESASSGTSYARPPFGTPTQFSNAQGQKIIRSAFESYYKERYPTMTSELAASQQMFRVMAGQGKAESSTRHMMLKMKPKWLNQNKTEFRASYRPQASFLEKVEQKGTLPVQEQKPSRKFLAMQWQENQRRVRAAAKVKAMAQNRNSKSSNGTGEGGGSAETGEHEGDEVRELDPFDRLKPRSHDSRSSLHGDVVRTRSTTSSTGSTGTSWYAPGQLQKTLEQIITKDIL
ncbi:hypothetical protein BGZ83_012097 [Gryganskiella cystojenkinii]|nr:hypothetical protein BGZ83_012097 [Gryganskiella cystojenkinii]